MPNYIALIIDGGTARWLNLYGFCKDTEFCAQP